MKKLLFFIIVLISLISCVKEEISLEVKTPKRVLSKSVLLILGEDYYSKPSILNYLKSNYGLETESSYVSLFTYEDMLNSAGTLILRTIIEKIENTKCDIVIALGAPEGSAKYFTQAKTTHPEKVFVSLLPMEDTLPLEAACDMVVDFKLPDTLLNEEEAFSISDNQVELLILSSIFASEDLVSNQKKISISIYEEFNRAFFAAYSVLYSNAEEAPSFRVSPYLDPETSIPSRTYFIVNEISKLDDNATSEAH